MIAVSIRLKSTLFNKSPTLGTLIFVLKSVIVTTVFAVLDWYHFDWAKFANSDFNVAILAVETSTLLPRVNPLLWAGTVRADLLI